jgi:hypothetical protein
MPVIQLPQLMVVMEGFPHSIIQLVELQVVKVESELSPTPSQSPRKQMVVTVDWAIVQQLEVELLEE